jgi:DNA processing protein
MHDYQVNHLYRSQADYPALLNKVPDGPEPLYFLGDFKPAMFEKALAVVGSRAMTMYGEWVVSTIVKDVARCGVTIVSGFMYGIDALAHRTALDAGGTTVAVMAGGVDYIFPSQQEDLYWEIADKGMVVSEYHKPDFGGKWMFARRNRIVAGLAQATLVVEAGCKSGSLITAGFARKYDRHMLTVPGNLDAPNSVGNVQLLKGGAKMVTCADDILKLYFEDSNNYRQKASSAVNKRLKLRVGEELHYQVVNMLRLEPLTLDQLVQKSQLEVPEVLRCITGLTLLGHVVERAGKYYAA